MKTNNLIKRKNGTWYVTAMVDGQRISKSTGKKNLREATKIRDEILSPLKLKDKVDVLKALEQKISHAEDQQNKVSHSLSIEDVWDTFTASSKRPDSAERTLKDYSQQWNIFLKWLVANNPEINAAKDITATIAEKFIKDLKHKKYSPRSRIKYLNFLQLLWRVCKKEGDLQENVWDKDHIARPVINRISGRKQAITLQELHTLLEYAEDKDIHDLLVLLAYTGQRLGDIANLRWDAVDINSGAITITPRKTARKTGVQVNIPILPKTREVLMNRTRFPDDRYVLPEIQSLYSSNATSITNRIKSVFQKAGFNTTKDDNSARCRAVYGAHSLRHTFTTIARASGLPDAYITSITGHMSHSMVEHYTHFDEQLASAFGQKTNSNNRNALVERINQQINTLTDEQLVALEKILASNVAKLLNE